MQDYSNTIRIFMQMHGLSQNALAKQAGVSQPTVSRALSNKQERHGEARQKLFSYIQENMLNNAWAGQNEAQSKVMAAFNQVWDNTSAHADAIARVILSLSGLKPQKHRKQR